MSDEDRNEAMREAARAALRELIPDLVQDLLVSTQAGDGQGPDTRHVAQNGHGVTSARASANGRDPEPAIVPLVPAPPIAAVLRPSTWRGSATPNEVIGGGGLVRAAESPTPAPSGAPAPPAGAPARPARVPQPASAPSPATTQATLRDGAVETVRIDSDEDLDAFVRSLVGRLESPRDRLAIKAGRLRFHLHRSAGTTGAPGPRGFDDAESVRVEKGAVTERHVRDAAAHGARLVLGRGAVLTPLARDTARSLGVQIEREGRC